MKAWRTLLGLGFCSLLAIGCTITSGNDDDDDDVNSADDASMDDAPTDDDPPKDSGTQMMDDTPSKPDAGKPGPEEDASTPNPPAEFKCDVKAADTCEACMATSCCEERKACASSSACAAEWSSIKKCMDDKDLANNIPDDALMELQECLAAAAPKMDQLNLSDETFGLTECIGMAVMDAGAGMEGDGTCTEACYGVFTLEPI